MQDHLAIIGAPETETETLSFNDMQDHKSSAAFIILNALKV